MTTQIYLVILIQFFMLSPLYALSKHELNQLTIPEIEQRIQLYTNKENKQTGRQLKKKELQEKSQLLERLKVLKRQEGQQQKRCLRRSKSESLVTKRQEGQIKQRQRTQSLNDLLSQKQQRKPKKNEPLSPKEKKELAAIFKAAFYHSFLNPETTRTEQRASQKDQSK